MAHEYSIGRMARETGCKVQTIRYYEQIGLLPPAMRTAGNQRVYSQDDRNRLAFIRHSRELGFHLDAIRKLLSLSDDPDHSCDEADVIAKEQLAEVEHRIARLQSLKGELESMIKQCKGGKIKSCRVVEVLSDHSLCHDTDHGQPDTV
ncbi:MerR family transcriptional regulator [Aestuariispira insulae]|uniref:DNA-binding transcriptional MerR regulator n=1 Tax=Aestuariispira insulae TaxID=1461337 RepID=A0A3D9H8H3_9PROT|nr:helix-turn-helix domain-containing protein [Aestuariispira insulae]RED45775.1 DNA-binding transcriptional MerR regulator [Aestuariispira insulae]